MRRERTGHVSRCPIRIIRDYDLRVVGCTAVGGSIERTGGEQCRAEG